MACSGCPDPIQCNQSPTAAPLDAQQKKQQIGRPQVVAGTGKGHALEYNRRLAGERYPSRVPAEVANFHNRSGNSYCESDPTLPRQCLTASRIEDARQLTEQPYS